MQNTVLIVEDSEAFARSVEAAFAVGHQFNVLVAYTFAEASRLVDSHREDIFAAICDLHLPDAKDGAAVKMMAQEGIPCIAFTGMFSPELRETILKLGVADYVLKHGQQDIDYVVSAVDRLWRNRDTHVLVVEDDEVMASALSKILRNQCYQVNVVHGGEQALQFLKQQPCRIVIIDIVLRGMDGFSLLSEIRHRFDLTEMAVLGISGQSSSVDIAKFMKYGGNDFLLKPFEQEQVVCRINNMAQLLDQFDRLNQLNLRKNELLGMAAHDIRGPLGVVLSATTMLQREVSSEQGKMLAELAIEAADNMEELLNGLLDISAIEEARISITMATFDLHAMLGKVLEDARILAFDKDQLLVADLPADTLQIEADEARLREVLRNLLSNAIKYSQRGQTIRLSLNGNADKVRIQVEDEAGGIPEAEQDQLFRPFAKISTTPTEGERSTGLGLAICQRIIKLHHGEISFRSQGSGSVFEVILPLTQPVSG